MKAFAWHRSDDRKHPTLDLYRIYISECGRYTIWQGRPADPQSFIYRVEFPDGTSRDCDLLRDAKRTGRRHDAGLDV